MEIKTTLKEIRLDHQEDVVMGNKEEATVFKSAQDFKQIMCGVYCKSYVSSSDRTNSTCKSCALNPDYRINFELGSNVKPLANISVLHDGRDLINQYQEAEFLELLKRFQLEVK